MKSLKLSKNSILLLYLGVLLLGLIFYLTGYSFSFSPLNILLIIIIVSYPVLKFILSGIKPGLKVLIGLCLIIPAVFIFWNVPVMMAFAHESTLSTLREWNFRNYKIYLNEKQGWSGGPYLQYDLISYRCFGLVNKNIAVGFPEKEKEDHCRIQLKEDYYSDLALFEFDTCNVSLEKVHHTASKR